MTSSTWQSELNGPDERLVHINLQLAKDPRLTQLDRARHNANRIGSFLCVAASVVAIYDLSLLFRLGH